MELMDKKHFYKLLDEVEDWMRSFTTLLLTCC